MLNLREKDPYLEREGQHYDHPLPSREWIIELLEQKGVPAKAEALARELSITDTEYEFFERRLKTMARGRQVLIDRRGTVCVTSKIDLVKCRIEAHKDGFGFAIPLQPTGGGDFILYERQMHGVIHGDVVTACPAGIDHRGRCEGTVLDIVEHAQEQVVDRSCVERGITTLEAEGKRLTQSIALEPGSMTGFKPESGQVVVAEVETYPELNRPAIAKIIEVLGGYVDSDMEIEITVRRHRLPHQFSGACWKAAERIPDHVRKSSLKGKVDLRNLPLVTIDDETAHDFDDTVFAEKIGRNYRLVVTIAGVSHYVRPNNAIDSDVLGRATSVYFLRRVIPMLLENPPNGICPLDPDVERLCMVCDMMVTYADSIKEYKFYPAVMRSHAQLTCDQVWSWLSDGLEHPYKEQIDTLCRLFKVSQKKRSGRGAAEFESVETQIVFDGNDKIEKIVPVACNDAYGLIEECMLAANVCATEFLLKSKHTALLRNHLGPTPGKLATLRKQLALTGLSLGGRDNPTPKDYAVLTEQFKERPDAELLQVIMLRSMRQAVYKPSCDGHFDLAYGTYAHFTSSIRRYPDLTVHRAVRAVLAGEKYNPGKSWQELDVHTSFYEHRADDASRDIENWLRTCYMRDKVGEVSGGKISGMTSFDIFVTLDDIHIGGLVHISDLGKDYFSYRPKIMTIESERSDVHFSMGDHVSAKVAHVGLDTSKIDLLLISGGTTGKRRGKKVVSASKSPSELAAKKGAVKAARSRKSRVGIKEADTLTKETGKSDLHKKSVSGKAKTGKKRKNVRVVVGSRSKTKSKPKAGNKS